MSWTPPPYPADPGDSPGGPSSEERTWALVSHIGSLVSAWFALGILCPLLVLLLKGSSPFVRRHALESLNYQLTLLLLIVAATVVTILTLGIGLLVIVPVGVVIAVLALVFIIMATMRASNGEDYRYPLSIRLIN
ncbi:MAG: DUF4870 domain-containing protein [Nocardioides sp.]|nr:DUF4870 domain-containing protein [Nocardioides sp.]